MSKAANDLIERLEEETGQRIDDNDGDNMAMSGLFGATSRLLGQSPPTYRERNDVVAGMVIRYRMTPAYLMDLERDKIAARLLALGFSPDYL